MDKSHRNNSLRRTSFQLFLVMPLLALAGFTLAGCNPVANSHRDLSEIIPPPHESANNRATQALNESETVWNLILIKDNPIGYSRTEFKQQREANSWQQETVLNLTRFGQTTQQTLRLTSLETPTHFEHAQWDAKPASSGSISRSADGQRIVIDEAGAALVEVPLGGNSINGFFAAEDSLRRQPMRPGESRTVQGLMPMMHQPVKFVLTAKTHEDIGIHRASERLLHIDTAIHTTSGVMHSTLWTNEQGQIRKQWLRELDQVAVCVDEATAIAATSQSYDLSQIASVKLQFAGSSIPDLHRKNFARYAITNLSEQPLSETRFANDDHQVTQRDGQNLNRIVIEVRTQTETQSGTQSVIDRRTLPAIELDAATKPTRLINYESELIDQLANSANGTKTNGWELACQFETIVHAHIKQKDYSQLLLDAETVARNQRGDCTEHAVLLAALCRAKGIPARVAIGLVYVPVQQSFVFHMWNEVHVDGTWRGLDATLGLGGIGAGHIKAADSFLENGSAITDFLPVAALSGKISIELLSTE